MPLWLSKSSKNNFFAFLSFLSLFLFSFPCFSQDALPVEQVVLANHATILEYTDPNLKMVAIAWMVKTGSLDEAPLEGSGVAHLLEHMIFKGAEGGAPGALTHQIQSLGGEVNAATSNDYTYYYAQVPAKHYLKTLELVSDAVLNPQFRQEDFEKEKNVILREFDYRESLPDYQAYRKLFEQAYVRHGYRIPPIGYQEKFKKLTFMDLKNFYSDHYTSQNMFISVAGDINPERVEKTIQSIFQTRRVEVSSATHNHPQIQELPFLFPKKSNQPWIFKNSKLIYAFQTPGYQSSDFFTLEILAMILGEGRSSRFYQRALKEGNIALSIEASHNAFAEGGLFIFDATFNEKNKNAIDQIFKEELEKIKTQGITVSELNRAKKTARQLFIQQREAPASLAFSLCFFEAFLGNYTFLDSFETQLNQVSAEDVQKAAIYYLNFDHSVSLHSYPFQENEKEEAPSNALQENEIHRIEVLPGVVVLLKKDTHVPNVALNAFVKAGSLAETNATAGFSNFLGQLMTLETQKHDPQFLQEEIESLGSSLEAGSGNNTLSFSLTVLKEDASKGLGLLKEIIEEPQFTETNFLHQKNLFLNLFDSEKDDLFSYANRLIRNQLFQNHPFKFPVLGDRKVIENATLDQIKRFYSEHIVTSELVICAFGDIDEEKVISQIKTLFSARSVNDLKVTPSIFLPSQSQEEATSQDQALVVIGYPGTIYASADYYALLLYSELLGGTDGVLSMRLREQKGWVYTTGSNQSSSLIPGYLVFYAACEPTRTSQVIDKIKDTLINFSNVLTDDNISRAKQSLLGEWTSSSDAKTTLAYQMGVNEVLGIGYKEYLEFPKRINALQKEDLNRVARNYFHADTSHVVILKPSLQNGSNTHGS